MSIPLFIVDYGCLQKAPLESALATIESHWTDSKLWVVTPQSLALKNIQTIQVAPLTQSTIYTTLCKQQPQEPTINQRFLFWLYLQIGLAASETTEAWFIDAAHSDQIQTITSTAPDAGVDLLINSWSKVVSGYVRDSVVILGICHFLEHALTQTVFDRLHLQLASETLKPWGIEKDLFPITDSHLIRLYCQDHSLITKEARQLSGQARQESSDFPPLVYIHRGECPFFSDCLSANMLFNPNNNAIVISDFDYTKVAPKAEFLAIDRYMSTANQFANHYFHGSIYTKEFELFCFQRWFILRDFMRENRLAQCIALDSDVILYSNINEAAAHFNHYDIALPARHSPHCIFINSLSVLEKFCSFIEKLFAEGKDIITKRILLDSLYQVLEWKENMQPINDMLLFQMFGEYTSTTIGDTSQILRNGTFDYALGHSESGYELSEGIKKLTWKDGFPWTYHVRRACEIQMHCIHYRGGTKGYIRQHLEESRTSRKSA